MAYYSAFQSNCFQGNAFQIKRGASTPSGPVLLGGGPGKEREHVVNPHAFQYRQEQLRRKALEAKQDELKRIDDEIAEAEKRRLAALKRSQAKLLAENAAKKLAVLEASLQDEISRLLAERVWLIRQIDDEECLLILLMCKRRRII